jgi:hypothetical protein
MVTLRVALLFLMRSILCASIWLISVEASAQIGDVYTIGIKLKTGGPAVAGFLHSVDDSTVTFIPGAGGRKGLKRAQEHSQPISIPISLIKKVAVVKVRSAGHWFMSGLLISAGYSVGYLLLVPPFTTVGGLVVYVATVTTATLLTMDLIYAKKYRPDKPGFTVNMQQYCLVKSGISVDRQ